MLALLWQRCQSLRYCSSGFEPVSFKGFDVTDTSAKTKRKIKFLIYHYTHTAT